MTIARRDGEPLTLLRSSTIGREHEVLRLAARKETVPAPWVDDPTCHGMKGDLEFVTHKGATHRRRQDEPANGARIRFYVHERSVVLVDVHTHHPNATKQAKTTQLAYTVVQGPGVEARHQCLAGRFA